MFFDLDSLKFAILPIVSGCHRGFVLAFPGVLAWCRDNAYGRNVVNACLITGDAGARSREAERLDGITWARRRAGWSAPRFGSARLPVCFFSPAGPSESVLLPRISKGVTHGQNHDQVGSRL